MSFRRLLTVCGLLVAGMLLYSMSNITSPTSSSLQRMRTLEDTCVPTKLVTQVAWQHLDAYAHLSQTGKSPVQGWIADAQLFVTRKISEKQLSRCALGTVGEIGVHHGRFFIGLALASHPREPVVAIDLFGDQKSNVDKSGKGNLNIFLNNVKANRVDSSRMHVMEGDSTLLTVKNFSSLNLPQFRMLSVDGAHFYSAVMSDLKLATTIMLPEGVIIVDDFINPTWVGVLDATMDFLSQSNYAPFLWICNKLYLASKEYHSMYYELVTGLPHLKCLSTMKPVVHPSRYTIRGHKVCTTTFKCTMSGAPMQTL